MEAAPRIDEPTRPEEPPQSEESSRAEALRPVTPVEAPAPRPAADASAGDGAAFMRAFARGAGLPEALLEHFDAAALGELLGALMRATVEDVKQLLAARFEAKRMAKSGNQTQIQMLNNNPLKFTPTADDALKIMFGPPTRGYLDARRTLEQSFSDIKAHQVDTYAAMQGALRELIEDFDPAEIKASLGREGGLTGLIGSRKARAWDLFVTRWQAKSLRQDDGMLGAFMAYFSKHYDRGGAA